MKPLEGKVALVAGGTRGAGRGIAMELGAAGATVYITGRTTRNEISEYGRPETIEETADLVNNIGGIGIAVQADHLIHEQVQSLIERIEKEHGRLDILVNDIWGGEYLVDGNTRVWEHSLEKGLRMLRLAIDTHLITSHYALPLLIKNEGGLVIEMTDGTKEYNNENYRLPMFYDLAKTSVIRMAEGLAHELVQHHCTAVSLTPGWMRSEIMLDHYGVKEENWLDATKKEPHFVISETPRYVGRAVAALAGDLEVSRWNGQSLSSGKLAQVYGFTDLDGSQPDCWRYIVEVQDAGKQADATGYR
ncbi:short chain dehydrogenase [Niallia circulans]|jgi:NAD(P)-dependent dehydrogenase (short-subunit alcohol dehydrogenase family)|uniref:SDR family oxidoreductase n=1 Tax=Bacillales TaxID=1385 RepID=UPI000B96667E|nr:MULTISPECIES: SDR family oxidoreductase [Bacillales]SPU17799.1 short chain dehydrogenase [Niallia circulans]AST95943.1 short-chain dehydrogenase [Shouchella clausii]MCM3548108.1 SDR family oxidoreductase [Shouchella clausii]MCR1287040.1 SDR family oxidoreductase [Shouchella clausii]MEB5471465.1 SDR family oxidoreductase [Shouchella clausii]